MWQWQLFIEDISQGAERFAVPVFLNADMRVDLDVFRHFAYAPRLIDSNGHIRSRKSSPTFACSCNGGCDDGCECSSGIYTNVGTVDDMEVLMSDIVRECNETCECALWCGNRVAQKGAIYPVEIFSRDSICGWGVRASHQIPFGAYIGEYTGELLSEDEAASRDSTFLFETRIGSEIYTIDAKYTGNYTRFINHSCNPNVKVANVSWDFEENELIHMCFYTSKTIEKHEELTIDYGSAWWNNKMFNCLCNSKQCRYQGDIEKLAQLI
ncbi:unnamed protein product [Caenorhabditis bovis]|uniref:SET domain-containing protein n=1 Tax=Caenorhabditis bovis TaxID=2654633 RepID=A0A8S1FDU0_9PELO|nr:unnamed protein product [Caenorhabditis bovis]